MAQWHKRATDYKRKDVCDVDSIPTQGNKYVRFSYPRSDYEAKRGVEFRPLTSNISRIQ